MASKEPGLFSLSDLQVPPDFAKYEDTAEAETIVRLEEWKRRAYEVLSKLQVGMSSWGAIETRRQAEVVYRVAAFDGDSPWVLQSTRDIAREILSSHVTIGTEVIEEVLLKHIKPAFQANPHPSINVETGRKLTRDAGGPLGYMDYLEGQVWKLYPANTNVISWCITHADTRTVEKLWHLFIPPIMTLLDDHEPRYKLQGTQLAYQLLEIALPDLLRRTGIDILLQNSFKRSLTFLHAPESPELVRTAVRAWVRLIERTTGEGSEARFEQLCSLLGDSIMGNIWVYASREPETLQASIDVIPDVVELLGIGSSRYLKGLVPQLVFPLVPSPENGTTVRFKLASARALDAVLRVCAVRAHKWSNVVLEAVLKCWVDLADNSVREKPGDELRDELRSICRLLLICHQQAGSTLVDEYRRVITLDSEMFGPLLQPAMVEA